MIKDTKRLFLEVAKMVKYLGLIFTVKYFFNVLRNIPGIIETRSLGIVDAQNNNIIKVKYQGFRFVMMPDAISTFREIFLKNCYGFDMRKEYATVMDLGANRGVFTVMAACRSKKVISVECDNVNMPQKYKAMADLNNIKNSVFVNKFISNIDNVGKVSINRLVDEFGIREISFLKIDIEGAEKDLFSSNLEWLDITRQISMEVHPCFGMDEQEILASLNSRGFQTVLLDKDLREVQSLSRAKMGYIRAKRC